MPQQFKHFNIFMVSFPGAIGQKNDFTLAIPVNFVFFKSQYFPVGGKQNLMFYLELSHFNDWEFQLQLALEGSYGNGNCTEDTDYKENMHASRESSIGQLKINFQTPVNFR